MQTVCETLYERVDKLIEADKGPLLAVMGTQAAIRELATRNRGLEKAVRELAAEVERLAAAQDRL